MAFRKRNVGLARATVPGSGTSVAETINTKATTPPPLSIPGVRPSPVDGRPTTSTGASSLDNILAGHAGLALGHSILIEESGTTDYAGTLLRYCAAEGIVQGQQVHVVGVPPHWGRDLPGVVGRVDDENTPVHKLEKRNEKMKIAWRYERLGEFGADIVANRASPAARERIIPTSEQPTESASEAFCHVFDLAKRLDYPAGAAIDYISIDPTKSGGCPYDIILQRLFDKLSSSNDRTIHRLIIPTLLSPAIYPGHASEPKHILGFFHALRKLLRQFQHRLIALITLPLELYPRLSGIVRWMELISDGVVELTPFPHELDETAISTSGAATAQEERPQGLIKVHKLPVFHDRGGGGGELKTVGDDLAFTVSRRKFVIKPFSLPPAEGDKEAQQGHPESDGKPLKSQMEF